MSRITSSILVVAAFASMGLVCRPGMTPQPLIVDCLRYDEIQQKFIHNSYGSAGDPVDEQLVDMLLFHRIRAFELDLQAGSSCTITSTPPWRAPDWRIAHTCAEIRPSNTPTLRQALALVRAFHTMQPRHEVITIDLELGSRKAGGLLGQFAFYSADQFDALLQSELQGILFTPQDLLARHPGARTLHAAVKPDASGRSGWPTVDELRGRVIIVIHGVAEDVNAYFGSSRDSIQGRAAFQLDEGQWDSMSRRELGDDEPLPIFHGEVPADRAAELRTKLAGHILRSKQIDDCNTRPVLLQCTGDQNRQRAAEYQRNGIHMLFMNMGSAHDPAFNLTNPSLYPFGVSLRGPDGQFPSGTTAVDHLAVIGKREPGSLLLAGDASGGDIENNQDTFTFWTLPGSEGVNESWVAEIASASNGSVHPHGKGMLMARAAFEPDAAYCAVGRTADRYGLRTQWRSGRGLGTGHLEQFGNYGTADVANRSERENWHFVMLTLAVADGRTRCRAAVSADGRTWQQLGDDMPINERLGRVGVAVASNSGYNVDNARTYAGENRFMFAGLRRSDAGAPFAEIDLAQLVVQEIGGGRRATDERVQGPDDSCKR